MPKLLPVDPAPPEVRVRLLPPENWAAEKGTNIHILAGAFTFAKWERGITLIQESEFDYVIDAVLNLKFR